VLVDIKPFVGTVTNFTLKKQNEDSMTVKINNSRPSLKKGHSSAVANHVKTSGHDIKWDHFDILAF